uniref:Uncharacterized protein n=1 Tax=Cacopsylla melanoneura TaxID=428564 RepID=A0A8D8QMG4_9HEMI
MPADTTPLERKSSTSSWTESANCRTSAQVCKVSSSSTRSAVVPAPASPLCSWTVAPRITIWKRPFLKCLRPSLHGTSQTIVTSGVPKDRNGTFQFKKAAL